MPRTMLHLLFALLSISEAARAAGLLPGADAGMPDERGRTLLDRDVLQALEPLEPRAADGAVAHHAPHALEPRGSRA